MFIIYLNIAKAQKIIGQFFRCFSTLRHSRI